MKRTLSMISAAMLVLSTVGMILANGPIGAEIPGNLSKGEPPIKPSYTPHAPIRIDSNGDFAANANGGGDGSAGNPWIIENYDIDGTGVGYCIYIGNTTDYFVVRNCYLHDASGGNDWPFHPDAGLALYEVTLGEVINNTATNNYYGIGIGCSSNNTISKNTASSNLGYGIALTQWCNDTAVSSNIVSDNFVGIGLNASSSRNTIFNNIVSDNFVGIGLNTTSSNIIYHNNFINNTHQANDDSTNFWDNTYPSGGNYWSDYAGVDTMGGLNQDLPGADGIGDTPYVSIEGGAGAHDNYPMMGPIQAFVYTFHLPFRINSDADFTFANGVSAGDGTPGNPWIIEGWDINGTGYGYCIYIGNTTDYFEVRNSNLHEAGGNSATFFWNSGLVLYSIRNGQIRDNNVSSNNDCGIRFRFTNSSTLSNNHLCSNIFGGISLFESDDNLIINNTVTSGTQYCINIGNSNGNNIANNTVTNNAQIGIWLSDSDNNNITKNTAINNTLNGIYLASSNNNNIENNTVSNNDYGINLGGCFGNVIANNTARLNDYGITFDNSNNNMVTENIVNSNNVAGIQLRSSDTNKINLNYVSLNTDMGIWLESSSDNNIVTNNTVSNNHYYGVLLASSINNTLFHNNFINNFNQASGNTSPNIWNLSYPSGGNYWNDYLDVDVMSGPLQNVPGADGIGDTPYTNIGGGIGAQDHYPLMNATMPSVVSTVPDNAAVGIEISQDILITFSKAMNPATFTYMITPNPGGLAPMWGGGNTTLTISHTPLTSDTMYWVNITAAMDMEGNPLNPIPYSFSFMSADIEAPTITATVPPNAATNVALTQIIQITYSEAMDTASFIDTISPNPGGLSIVWTAGNTIATITHTAFASDTLYWVNITAATDVAGNALVPLPYSFSFTTVLIPDATATAIGPVGGPTNATAAILAYTWSGIPASVNLYYTTDGGTSWALAGNDATVDGNYTFTLTDAGTYGWIASAVGGGSVEPSPPADGTAPEAASYIFDNVAPTVVSTIPLDDAVDVPIDTDIVITFSEPMNISVGNGSVTPNPGGLARVWSGGNTILTISHTALAFNTTYWVNSTGRTDMAGNALDPPSFSFSFTTVPATSTPVDSDGDGVPDDEDAFPDDPAASVDTDDDGMPDEWNEGYTADDSTTGLELDDDDDNDEIPDSEDDDPLNPNDTQGGSDILWIVLIIIIIVVVIAAVIGMKVMKGRKPDVSVESPEPSEEQPPQQPLPPPPEG